MDLINHCRSCAVNLGHTRIEWEDIPEGSVAVFYRSYQGDRLGDPRCVAWSRRCAHAFIDVASRLDQGGLHSLLEPLHLEKKDVLRLYIYCFGTASSVSLPTTVRSSTCTDYDDARLLMGKIKGASERAPERVMFAINPVFWPGLGIREARKSKWESNECRPSVSVSRPTLRDVTGSLCRGRTLSQRLDKHCLPTPASIAVHARPMASPSPAPTPPTPPRSGRTGVRVSRLGLGGVALSGAPPATDPQRPTPRTRA